jgi:hypothetical protein
MDAMTRPVLAALVACGWIIYVGIAGYVAWQISSGEPPSFIKNYTLGTNAAWLGIGFALFVATEWVRLSGDRS